MELQNTIIVLIGFGGTGKYTIGREVCRRTGAKLIHNHLINNPIFTVLDTDGITPLPKGIWDKVRQVRQVVYDSIRELSPPDLNFVFTNQLIDGDVADQRAFDDLVALAADRESLLVPIRLVCEVEELCRRVVGPGREEMLKGMSVESARARAVNYAVLDPPHPNVRTIDVTRRRVSDSADAILEEVRLIRETAT